MFRFKLEKLKMTNLELETLIFTGQVREDRERQERIDTITLKRFWYRFYRGREGKFLVF